MTVAAARLNNEAKSCSGTSVSGGSWKRLHHGSAQHATYTRHIHIALSGRCKQRNVAEEWQVSGSNMRIDGFTTIQPDLCYCLG